MLYRDEVIAKPMKLKPGQVMGPFRLDGDKKVVTFHEDEDTQVYTSEKVFLPHKPDDMPDGEKLILENIDKQAFVPPEDPLKLNE